MGMKQGENYLCKYPYRPTRTRSSAVDRPHKVPPPTRLHSAQYRPPRSRDQGLTSSMDRVREDDMRRRKRLGNMVGRAPLRSDGGAYHLTNQ